MTDFDLGDPAPDADDDEVDDQPGEESTNEPTPAESRSATEVTPETDPTDKSDQERDPTETGPAFPYSEVRQSPLYAREETWTEFEDQLDFTVTPELRRMGIRDDELREIHDIVLEIALDNIEEIPERLAEKRR